MQVNINITLTQDDIDAGLTADAAVQKAFPNGATEAPYVDTSLVQDFTAIEAAAEAAAQKELDEQVKVAAPAPPAPPTLVQDAAVDYDEVEPAGVIAEVEVAEDYAEAPYVPVQDPAPSINNEHDVKLDSAGVPWTAEIHSSNQKKYGASSKEPGRWIWKKGSDSEFRAARAAEFAAAVHSRADDQHVSAPVPPPVPVAENPVPVDSPVPPTVSSPVPPSVATAVPVSGDLPTTWPAFLQSLKQSGKTAGDVTPHLASVGVETIAQLASNDEARNSIAAALGLVA